MKITNISAGPRGVNSVSGIVLVEPGQSVDVAVFAREQRSIEASGWFEAKGSYEENPAAAEAAKPVAGDTNANAASIALLTEQVSALTTALSAAMSRGGTAEAKVPAADQPAGLIAKHAGGGSWFVFDGDEKLGEAMSRDDAEAFNKLSDADKAALVKKG